MNPAGQTVQIVLDEGLGDGFALEALLVQVQEQRARQGLVVVLADRFERWEDRTAAIVHGEQLQVLPVPMVGADAEEAERVGLCGDAGGQLFLILAGGVVLTAVMGGSHDLLGEHIVGA